MGPLFASLIFPFRKSQRGKKIKIRTEIYLLIPTASGFIIHYYYFLKIFVAEYYVHIRPCVTGKFTTVRN